MVQLVDLCPENQLRFSVLRLNATRILCGVSVCLLFTISILVPSLSVWRFVGEILRLPLFIYLTYEISKWYGRKKLQEQIAIWINNESKDVVNTIFRLISDSAGEFSDILTGANLQNCDFSGTNIQNLNLSRANLVDANFQNSKLSGVKLRNAKLDKANFKHVSATGCNFKYSSLKGADLTEAQIQASKLCFADMSYSLCNKTSFFLTNLTGARLIEVDLTEGDLQTTRFMFANLTNANLRKVHGKVAIFSHAKLNGVNFEGAYLSAASFFEADLTDTKFDTHTILPDNQQWTPETDVWEFKNVKLYPDNP